MIPERIKPYLPYMRKYRREMAVPAGDDELPNVLNRVRTLLKTKDDTFDATWFGNDLLVIPGSQVCAFTPHEGM